MNRERSKKISGDKRLARDAGDVFILSHSDIHFSVHYPERNPISAIDDITERLAHVGAFGGIKHVE